jgi:hypothetical protein
MKLFPVYGIIVKHLNGYRIILTGRWSWPWAEKCGIILLNGYTLKLMIPLTSLLGIGKPWLG